MCRFAPTLIALVLFASLTPTTARAEEAPEVIVPDPAPAPTPEPPTLPAAVNPTPPGAPGAPIPPPPPPPPVAPAPVMTLALAPAARPERRFGDAGVRVVGGTIAASRADSAAAPTETSFTVGPTFDYFLSPSFSAGASLVLGYDRLDSSGAFPGDKTWTFGVDGGLGANAWLGEHLSLWPRVSLAFEQTRRADNPPAALPNNLTSNGMTGTVVIAAGPPAVANIISAKVYAPLLVHLAPHFFLGFGPSFKADLHNATGPGGTSNRGTSFGASSLVGGWF